MYPPIHWSSTALYSLFIQESAGGLEWTEQWLAISWLASYWHHRFIWSVAAAAVETSELPLRKTLRERQHQRLRQLPVPRHPPIRLLARQLRALGVGFVSLRRGCFRFDAVGYDDLSPVASAPSSSTLFAPSARHIFVMSEENTSYGSVVGNTSQMPFINSLIAKGTLWTNFYANQHGSMHAYIETMSGTAFTCSGNDVAPAEHSPDRV